MDGICIRGATESGTAASCRVQQQISVKKMNERAQCTWEAFTTTEQLQFEPSRPGARALSASENEDGWRAARQASTSEKDGSSHRQGTLGRRRLASGARAIRRERGRSEPALSSKRGSWRSNRTRKAIAVHRSLCTYRARPSLCTDRCAQIAVRGGTQQRLAMQARHPAAPLLQQSGLTCIAAHAWRKRMSCRFSTSLRARLAKMSAFEQGTRKRAPSSSYRWACRQATA
eukprot:2482929-Pleurochrysis_carterae.AAC.2